MLEQHIAFLLAAEIDKNWNSRTGTGQSAFTNTQREWEDFKTWQQYYDAIYGLWIGPLHEGKTVN